MTTRSACRIKILSGFIGPALGVLVGYLICAFSNSEKIDKRVWLERLLSHRDEESLIEDELQAADSTDEGGGEEHENPIEATAVVCIVLLLILMTIGFEEAKERMEESANRNMKPIIEALFGEMTVLGFLSVCTFVVTKIGFFNRISVALFGEEEEDKLQEIFEFVHYSLFFVMVFFVAQVLELVKEAMETEEDWLVMDRQCRDVEYMKTLKERKRMEQNKGAAKNRFFAYFVEFYALLPYKRNVNKERIEDLIVFSSLREEFIKERSFDYPFRPAEVHQRVSEEFNFGRYLSMCLGHTLTHVVEVDILCWAFFAVFTILFFCLELVVGNDLATLAWIWLAIGWGGMIFNIHFEHHFHLIRNAFVPSWVESRSSAVTGENGQENESSSLLSLDDDLPSWCKVDMEKYMKNRSWLQKLVCGKDPPPRHHTLFWFERKGGKASVLILQLNLLCLGIYCALLLLAYIPATFKKHGLLVLLLYILLSAIPVVVIMLNKQHLVAIMSQTLSIGALRNPRAVANVIREEKTARVVRSFLILSKMQRAADSGFEKARNKTKNGRQRRHFSKSFDRQELAELEKTFDAFDESGDGNISTDEFGAIMSSLGVPMTEEHLKNMISVLDEDGDGEVSKEEFLQWYADQKGDDDLKARELANVLFRMFDQDGSGEISVAEFKSSLDAFNIGFTVDEVGELVKELDEDGNGSIGLEEFEKLIEKYHPRELAHDKTERSHADTDETEYSDAGADNGATV